MADELVYQEYEACPKKDEIQVMGPDSESHAMKSTQLAGMMTRPGAAEEGEVNEINLIDISTCILKIACEYLDYKVKHTWPE